MGILVFQYPYRSSYRAHEYFKSSTLGTHLIHENLKFSTCKQKYTHEYLTPIRPMAYMVYSQYSPYP